VQLEPANANYYLRMGDYNVKAGNKPGAVKAYYQAGKLFVDSGFSVKGIATYKMILRLAPAEKQARELMLAINSSPAVAGELMSPPPFAPEAPAPPSPTEAAPPPAAEAAPPPSPPAPGEVAPPPELGLEQGPVLVLETETIGSEEPAAKEEKKEKEEKTDIKPLFAPSTK